MRVLVAPDKFKSTLCSREVAQALGAGIRSSFPKAEVISLVVSDGGEGFLEALEQSEKLQRRLVQVTGPKGRPHQGFIGFSKKKRRVFIESSQATGFHLLTKKERNPLRTGSAGLADLLQVALKLKPAEIFIGLGSSATCDAGLPVAARFGWKFLDKKGRSLPAAAASLGSIAKILPPENAAWPAKIYAVADVRNPPLGKNGGVRIYSPQKGASRSDVEKLEKGMASLANIMKKISGLNLSRLRGGGAAGGLGLGLHFFFGAQIVDGAAYVFQKLGLQEKIRAASLVVTGEGSFDEQSFSGKITGQLVRAAQKNGKKFILVTGRKKIPEKLRRRAWAVFSVEEVLKKEDRSGKKESYRTLIRHGRAIGTLLSQLNHEK